MAWKIVAQREWITHDKAGQPLRGWLMTVERDEDGTRINVEVESLRPADRDPPIQQAIAEYEASEGLTYGA